MARVPDVKNRKKRMKTVVLSEEAFLVYKGIKSNMDKLGHKWDFSDFVSRVLIDRFGGNGLGKEELLIRDINLLQDERNRVVVDFEKRIVVLADRLRLLRAEREVVKEIDCKF